jgi:hypothetical protein
VLRECVQSPVSSVVVSSIHNNGLEIVKDKRFAARECLAMMCRYEEMRVGHWWGLMGSDASFIALARRLKVQRHFETRVSKHTAILYAYIIYQVLPGLS